MTSRRKKVFLTILLAISLLGLLGFIFRNELIKLAFRPTDSTISEGAKNKDSVKIISSDLKTPWGITFLPSGDMLVTERPGTVKRIASNEKVYPIEGVTETSEGGLLGIALHPKFEENHFVYLYSTYTNGEGLFNRVERYVYKDDKLIRDKVIIDKIPGSSNHDGGAIAFGPDERLYITTGDASQESLAQDRNSLAGKILRLNDDGSVPEDNPFNNPVYSYGHRNAQGITWDDQGRLWSTEHGPSGLESGRDELNLIESGANYGWPVITGDETRAGMQSPIAQSGDNDTWAPGAIVFIDGSLYFTGLRGQTLYQAEINDGNSVSVSLKRHFTEEFGRLRAAVAHDGKLYISTSNTDGRGMPKTNDDKILRISVD